MIKNVIFDIGDVLVHFRWKQVMIDLGFSEEEIGFLYKALFESRWWNEWDRGVIPEEEVMRHMKEEGKGLETQICQFFEHKGELVIQYPYVETWMKLLKEKGMKIYLLSNYPMSLFELHAKNTFTFLPYVDGKIVSGYVKHVKPEPEIYSILLRTYELNPEECVFIDDRLDNVEAAKKMGIHSILFEGFDKANKALETFIASKN